MNSPSISKDSFGQTILAPRALSLGSKKVIESVTNTSSLFSDFEYSAVAVKYLK